MATLYPTPQGDSVRPIVDAVRDQRRQTRDLQRPSGTRLASLVAQVQATLANITSLVVTTTTSFLSSGFTTGGMTATGNVSVAGTLSVTGQSSLGPIKSPYSRAHTVTSGYANAYWDGNGDSGVNVSSIAYKQDVAPAELSAEVQALLSLALVRFRYISAVEEYGDAAPVELGTIAEYVESIGLGEWVFRDAEGVVQGISYERLTIPLIAVVQNLDQRLKALEAR